MDARHLHHHLADLRGRQPFLRTLQPDTDRFKLWLGDLVELVNVAYGLDSSEMTALRGVLTSRQRLPADASAEARSRDYLERLDRLAALLDRFERGVGDPVIVVEPNGH